MSDLADRLVKHINCIGPCCENKRELLEAAERIIELEEERTTDWIGINRGLHKRIAELEAQELGFVATLSQQAEEIFALRQRWSSELGYLMALTGDLWPQNETTEELARHLLEVCPPADSGEAK